MSVAREALQDAMRQLMRADAQDKRKVGNALKFVATLLQILRDGGSLSDNEDGLIDRFVARIQSDESTDLEGLVEFSDESPVAATNALVKLAGAVQEVVDGDELGGYFETVAVTFVTAVLNPPTSETPQSEAD